MIRHVRILHYAKRATEKEPRFRHFACLRLPPVRGAFVTLSMVLWIVSYFRPFCSWMGPSNYKVGLIVANGDFCMWRNYWYDPNITSGMTVLGIRRYPVNGHLK